MSWQTSTFNSGLGMSIFLVVVLIAVGIFACALVTDTASRTTTKVVTGTVEYPLHAVSTSNGTILYTVSGGGSAFGWSINGQPTAVIVVQYLVGNELKTVVLKLTDPNVHIYLINSTGNSTLKMVSYVNQYHYQWEGTHNGNGDNDRWTEYNIYVKV